MLKGISAKQLLIASLATFVSFGASAGSLTPKQIMQKVSEARKLEGSESVMSLTIYSKGGDKRVRDIAMVSKVYDGGKTEKRLYRFLSPADVKGTGILMFDYETKNDDTWIFLPALRKTRRIVSSEKGKAFMGSEFSYADMNTPILDNYKLKILKEEKVGGVDCYLIEVLPANSKVADEEGYSKKHVWVGKSDFMIRKSVFWDLDGEVLKELTAKKIEMVDKKKKRYRAKYMEMVNKQNGRKSVFETKKIESAPNAKDEYFTTQYLERP
jgi:outer membrane lipoprotein-sorting protein